MPVKPKNTCKILPIGYGSDSMEIKNILVAFYQIISGGHVKSLVKQGLQLGKNVFIASDVLIDPSFPWLISIGDDCTLTSRVVILAHDASTKRHLGFTKIGKVSIGRKTFVGIGSIILPGIKIGENVIIGSGSVVTKDIPENSIAVGNPAVVIGTTYEFIERHRKMLEVRSTFNQGFTLGTGITEANKKIMIDKLENEDGYVI
jgi:maltose O-acetyltransferase